MGKHNKHQQTPPTPPAPQPSLKVSHLKTTHSYRVEKLSQYEFQAYRATRQDDGTYVEELFGNPTLFNLVMRRVFEAMNFEAFQVFHTNKLANETAPKGSQPER